eukprot:g17369.t1
METLRSCEAYDVTTDSWRIAPSLNVARAGARVVTIAGGKLAAVGGCDDVFGRAEMLASVEILKQGNSNWELLDTQLGCLATDRRLSTLADTANSDGALCGSGISGRPLPLSSKPFRLATARRSTVVSPFGAPQETKVEEEQGVTAEKRRPSPLCQVCQQLESRYRCPACEIRSCSAACVQAHKSQSGCTGKRPRTERVAPLNAFTDNVLLRDFGLLEEVDAAVDRADRDLRIRDEDCAEHAGNVDNRARAKARRKAAQSRATFAGGRAVRGVRRDRSGSSRDCEAEPATRSYPQRTLAPPIKHPAGL